MNLNQLQYFKILAQEEHYTRAAQMLSITQPSLSHAIAQLEEELGTRLFEKKGRNIVLTRYGKLFLPYVEESLKVLEEGVQRTRELNGSKEGIIHLAYIYTMGSNFTPKMVRNFLDAYPDYHIDFHFTVGTTGDILAGLKEDKGFRLEDNCLITEDGCENLSRAIPRQIDEIEAFMGRR